MRIQNDYFNKAAFHGETDRICVLEISTELDRAWLGRRAYHLVPLIAFLYNLSRPILALGNHDKNEYLKLTLREQHEDY